MDDGQTINTVAEELRTLAADIDGRLSTEERTRLNALLEKIERKSEAETARRHTEQLTALVDLTNWVGVGMLVLPDDFELDCAMIIDVNQRAADITGYSRRELLKLSPLDLFRFIDSNANLRQLSVAGLYTDVQIKNLNGFELFCRIFLCPYKLGDAKVWILLFRDISDYRQAISSLKLSREKFQLVQDVASIGICNCDLRTGRVDWSNECCRIFDIPSGQSITLDSDTIRSRIHPGDYDNFISKINSGLSEERFAFEFRIGPCGDITKYVSCMGMTYQDNDSTSKKLFLVFEDVSASRRMEMFISMQQAIGKAVISSLSVRELGGRLIEIGRILDGIDSGSIYLFDATNNSYDLIASSGIDKETLAHYYVLNDQLARDIIAFSDAPRYLSETDIFQLSAMGHPMDGLTAMAAIPVCYDNRPLGAMFYGSRSLKTIPVFIRNLLEMLATDIGAVIVRIAAEKALRISEENYRILIENLTDLVVRVDKKRRIVFVSRNCGRIFHCAAEEMIGRDFLKFISREQRRSVIVKISELFKTQKSLSFEQLVKSGEEEHWLSWQCNVVYDSKSGEIMTFIGIGRDVTDSHNTSKMLQHSEDRLRLILQSISGCIWEWDIVNNQFSHDDKLYHLLGYATGEFSFSITDMLRNALHPEDRPRTEILFSQLIDGQKDTLYASFRLRCKNSTYLWVVIRAVMVRGSHNEPLRMVGSIEDISDRKDFDRIKEKYLFLQKIIDALPLPVYYKNMQGRYIGFNKAAESSPHLPASPLVIGKHIFEVWEHDNFAMAEIIDEEEKKLILNGGHVAFPIHMDTQKGEDVVVHKSLITGEDGHPEYIVSAIVDVSELKRTENALKIASQRLNTILNVMHEIIIWFDENMKVVWGNHAAYEALGGHPAQEIIGMHCHKLWFDKDKKCTPCNFQKVFDSGRGGCEMLKTANGKIYESWFYPVQTSGSDRGWVQLALDITEQENARNEARLRQEQLIQADKMTSLGILVSGVAHEINNPNNFIVINISILKKAWENIMSLLKDYASERGDFNVAGVPYSRFSGMVSDLLEGIEEGSERIRVIVNDLKDYVRQTPVNLKGRFNVNDSLSRAFTLCRNMLKRASDNYRIAYGDNLPMVRGDVYRLEQVIINIVQNACQALKSKEGAIIIYTYYDEKQSEVVVEVTDDGVGIQPEQMKHIADPFFTTKRDIGGTGLGLSISKAIVEEHGGRLEIQSEPGKGTKVKVCLPPARD